MWHIVMSMIVFGNCITLTTSEMNCPKYTYRNGDLCFEPHLDRPSTFENANEICADSGSQLAIVSSEETEQFLGRLSLKLKNQNYWATNGTKVMKMCQALNSGRNFEFYEEDCHQNIYFICEKEKHSSKCQRKELEFDNKCFQISRHRQKYSNAKTHCESNGGSLAEINTVAKSHFIEKALQDDDWLFQLSDKELEETGLSSLEIWSGAIFDPIKLKWVSKNGIEIEYLNDKLSSTDSENVDKKRCIHNKLHVSHIGECEMHNFFFCQYSLKPKAAHHHMDHNHSQKLIINADNENSTTLKLTYGGIGVAIGVALCLTAIVLVFVCHTIKSNRKMAGKESRKGNQRNKRFFTQNSSKGLNSPIYKGTTRNMTKSQELQLLNTPPV